MKPLKTHSLLSLDVPLCWKQMPVKANFHGAFAPSSGLLFSAIEQIPEEIYGDIKIISASCGYFILLFSTEIVSQITPYPLKKSCNQPFIFHPADVAAVPYFSSKLRSQGAWPEILIATVANGKIEWWEFALKDTLEISDFLKISLPVFRNSVQTHKTLKPLSEFPIFQPEPLPKIQNMEEKQKQDLQKAKDPTPSLWERLLKKDPKPDWEKFKSNEEGLITKAQSSVRSFWSWVDNKIEKDPPVEKTGFIRKLLDPDQWEWLQKPGWLANAMNRQTSIFERLAKEFEQGNIETALKHSIPIDNELADTMQEKGWLSMGWQLPENILDYSLDILSHPLGGSGIAALGENLIYKLSLHYHKAAENLCSHGEYRKAAYVYSFLLKDYSRAAEVLEQGGYYLDAAALYREKLHNNMLAARVLERGGYTTEAAQLYLQEKEYEAAVNAYENAGMQEQARECLEKWTLYLIGNHQLVNAGDVLWHRLSEIERAEAEYRQELETGQKAGLAGSRLVHLKEATMGNGLKEFKNCQAILNAKPNKDQIDFYHHVHCWIKDSELSENFVNTVYYMSKKSLFSTIYTASFEKDPKVIESGVTEISQVLTNINDPLAIYDLRQEVPKIGQKSYSPAKIYGRKDTIFTKQLPDGQIIYGKGQRWGLLNPKTNSSKIIKMPFEILCLVVHGSIKSKEGILLGLIDREKRFIWAYLQQETIKPIAETQMKGIINAASTGFSENFLANTQEGEMICLMKNNMGYVDIVPITISQRLKFSTMVYWSASKAIIGAAECGDFHIFYPKYSFSETQGQEVEIQHVGSISNNIKVDFMDTYEDLAFFYGQGPALSFISWKDEYPCCIKLSGIEENNITAITVCGYKEGQLTVAIAYESGEIVFATIEKELKKTHCVFASVKTTIKTSLQEIFGMAVKNQYLFAIGKKFDFVVVDWEKSLLITNAVKLL